MKALKILFIIVTATTLLSSCKLSRKEAIGDADKYLNQANHNLLEGKQDTFIVSQAEFYTQQFVREFPGDSIGSKLLMRLGNLQQGLRFYDKAISIYTEIDSLYPKTSDGANATFSKAYVYANYLFDNNKAKDAYTEFLDKYPDYNKKMSDDAKFEMETLGLTPDQQFDLIMKRKQQQESTASAAK